jgi:hypothetical protein
MPSSHGKQKQAAKQKKKRELARRSVVRTTPAATVKAAVLRQAAALAPGPTYISATWQRTGEVPELVTLLVTRRAPGGVFLPAVALVDRTCLGIKNGFVAEPLSGLDLGDMVREMGRAHEGGMVPCEFLVAQSIAYHAIDYARSLGFAPHRDFPEPMFGPRPASLLETPLAHPAKPYYVSGPDDDTRAVIARLEAAVGPGNFDVLMLMSEDEA